MNVDKIKAFKTIKLIGFFSPILLLSLILFSPNFWVFIINGYQKFISPYKGFSCAYSAMSNTPSCSEFGKKAITEKGVIIGAQLIYSQLYKCENAFHILSDCKDNKSISVKNIDNEPCGSCLLLFKNFGQMIADMVKAQIHAIIEEIKNEIKSNIDELRKAMTKEIKEFKDAISKKIDDLILTFKKNLSPQDNTENKKQEKEPRIPIPSKKPNFSLSDNKDNFPIPSKKPDFKAITKQKKSPISSNEPENINQEKQKEQGDDLAKMIKAHLNHEHYDLGTSLYLGDVMELCKSQPTLERCQRDDVKKLIEDYETRGKDIELFVQTIERTPLKYPAKIIKNVLEVPKDFYQWGYSLGDKVARLHTKRKYKDHDNNKNWRKPENFKFN